MRFEGFHDLARRARDGDREAMDHVLVRLRPYLGEIARTYADPARPVGSTTDLVQESCLRAWSKIGDFRGGEDDEETFALFRAWMGRIVRNLGLNSLRDLAAAKRDGGRRPLRLDPNLADPAGARLAVIDPPAPSEAPSSIVRSEERHERVRAAIAALPDELGAAIVRMHYFEGLRLFEIARRLDLGYDRVRDGFRGSMRILRKELRGWL